ncbi:MAG: hypothetical protein ACRD9Q_04935 [Nitrososphaeraceae archaeon]
MNNYFISTFWLILPFFVVGSVLMVMDLALMAEGKDLQYFQYFILNFIIYAILRFGVFRKKEVQRIRDDEGRNTYFDNEGKVVHRDETKEGDC